MARKQLTRGGGREGEATVLVGAQEQSSRTKGSAATYGAMPAAHKLAIEEGQFSGVPRANRVCVVCQQGQREDERHVVF